MIARTGHFEPIAREAYPFVVPVLLVSVVAWIVNLPWISFFLLSVAVAVGLFFRNPERAPPDGKGLLVSPADGRVVEIRDGVNAANLSEPALTRISIFMSIFDVHVNRAPVTGKVGKITYTPGRFLDARDSNASSVNEQNSIVLEGEDATIEVVQVAGLVARRICCWIREGDRIGQGERLGMIRFGSRLDVYVPKEYSIKVVRGTRVKAGVSVLAELESRTVCAEG